MISNKELKKRVAQNCGVYDTRKYRYAVFWDDKRNCDVIKRVKLSDVGTTAVLDPDAYKTVCDF